MANQNLDIVIRVRGGAVASQEITKVGKATEQVGKETEQTNSKTANLRKTMLGMVSAGAIYKGFEFLKGAVNETTSLARQTSLLTKITGLDTQQAAGWTEMAQQRGIAGKTLNQGFISLARNITSAAQGSKSAQTAFAALGLNGAALQAQDARTQMGMLADSFNALPPGVNKASLAQKLFGRQGQAMLPILNQSSKELNTQIDELGKHSGMTKQNQQQALQLVKAQRAMQEAMVGVKVAIGTALIPVLQSLAQIITPIAQAFASAMQHSQAFRIAIIALGAALGTFVTIMAAVNLVGLEFNLTWGLIPALIAGIIIGLVMLYKKCAWFRDAVHATMGAVVAAFNWVKNAAVNVFNWIKQNWPLLVSILGGPFAAVAVQIIKHWNDIKGVINTVWGIIKQVGQFIAGVFTSAWSAFGAAISPVIDILKSLFGVMNDIAGVAGKVISAVSSVVHAGGSVLHAATFGVLQHGGYMHSAGSAIVGEAGPELVTLPQGAQVHPFKSGGSGGGSHRVIVPVYLDSRQIALAMGEYAADR